jgi:hypothetical protein
MVRPPTMVAIIETMTMVDDIIDDIIAPLNDDAVELLSLDPVDDIVDVVVDVADDVVDDTTDVDEVPVVVDDAAAEQYEAKPQSNDT